MKINPLEKVLSFLVRIDPIQCVKKASFKHSKINEYTYFVIGGCHSTKARRQLVREYLFSPYFKIVECKIYVGLTEVEANLMAWDHNNDNDYRLGMYFVQRVRFF